MARQIDLRKWGFDKFTVTVEPNLRIPGTFKIFTRPIHDIDFLHAASNFLITALINPNSSAEATLGIDRVFYSQGFSFEKGQALKVHLEKRLVQLQHQITVLLNLDLQREAISQAAKRLISAGKTVDAVQIIPVCPDCKSGKCWIKNRQTPSPDRITIEVPGAYCNQSKAFRSFFNAAAAVECLFEIEEEIAKWSAPD